jgi:hypothetical protein
MPPIGIPSPPNLLVPFELLRPDDLLALRFFFINLQVKNGVLRRAGADKDAVIVVELEPQHIAERAYFEPTVGYPVSPTDPDATTEKQMPVEGEDRARIAGRSRLAFLVPPDVRSIPCEGDALLDACSRFPLSIVGRAISPPSPRHGKQPGGGTSVIDSPLTTLTDDVTAIEAPWRLVLSPNEFGAWLHAVQPVASQNDGQEGGPQRVELWHSRLGAWQEVSGGKTGPDLPGVGGTAHDGRYVYERDKAGAWRVTDVLDTPVDYYRTVRAIASPDYTGKRTKTKLFVVTPPEHSNDPPWFRSSLDARDRHDLVGLTSNFVDYPAAGARTRVVRARRLMLSSLGAWLDLDYGTRAPATEDLPDPDLEILAWRHMAAQGRDEYVRVVYDGALFGYPFRSSLVKVTERRFEPDGAILRQYMYVVIRLPELTFPEDWRALPFRRVRATRLVTPHLVAPENSAIDTLPQGVAAQDAFWPTVGSEPYRFHLHFEDWEGRPSELRIPLIFIGGSQLDNHQGVVDAAVEDYLANAGGKGQRRRGEAHGQKIAFAETDAGSRGKTTLPATELEFGVEPAPEDPLPLPAGWDFKYAPTLRSANVRVPAIEHLVGSGDPLSIELDRDYVTKANWLSTSEGAVFARVPAGTPMRFPADKSGGVVTPNANIGGLSRAFGPVGGAKDAVGNFSAGTFKASDFFGGADAKILGGIDLFDIVADVFTDGNVPTLTSAPVYANDNPKQAPTQVRSELHWAPQVKPSGPFEPGGNASITVDATVITELASGKWEAEIHGTISDFTLNLFGFVILPFNSVAFDVVPDHKTHFSADMGPVTFGGPLAFVNELEQYLSGFLDPPSLAVTDDGVELGYSLELPEIAVGVLTIQNIAVGAALNLPFTGDPVRFRFAFCERDRPFGLLVYVFGGGGSFGIALGADGVEQIEASLEFGAAIAIDIGVASGGVHVMAGIYFSWQEPQNRAWLEGYLRMGGELDVLGLVSLSLEFLMSLAYESGNDGGKVWGEATLVAEVSVACFSDSVEMSVRREFGDPARPLASKMISQQEWSDYWSSFAPLAA